MVLVATVGLGGWFFYFIRVAPESVLRRPESFSHRRMTVARLSGEQGYRFFFVTNRRPNTTLLRPQTFWSHGGAFATPLITFMDC